jgi:hypothetical protein
LAIRTPSKKKEKMFVLLFVGTIKSMEWMCRLHVTIIRILLSLLWQGLELWATEKLVMSVICMIWLRVFPENFAPLVIVPTNQCQFIGTNLWWQSCQVERKWHF